MLINTASNEMYTMLFEYMVKISTITCKYIVHVYCGFTNSYWSQT